MIGLQLEVGTLIISSYQMESVLKAYNRQSQAGSQIQRPSEKSSNIDVVVLSSDDNRKETFDKISYSLLDVLLRNKPVE